MNTNTDRTRFNIERHAWKKAWNKSKEISGGEVEVVVLCGMGRGVLELRRYVRQPKRAVPTVQTYRRDGAIYLSTIRWELVP